MAAFERTGPLKLEPQLDGSASQGVDCGVAACVMALDDASYGLVRPSTEAIRKRMGNDRDATNPVEWKAAINSYADRFASLGLQPPRTSVVARATTNSGGSCTTSVAASSPPSTTAPSRTRSARSGRAAATAATMPSTSAQQAAMSTDGARKVPVYDPLADGRFPGCPNGRRPWPFWLVRAATGNVRDAKDSGASTPPPTAGSVSSSPRPGPSASPGAVSTGDPEGGSPDLPDVTELLDVIADTAGGIEEHIAAMSASLDALRPWLPATKESEAEPVAGVAA